MSGLPHREVRHVSAAKLSVRKTGQGYTGLETTLPSCHADVHRAALGPSCTTCHDAGSWTVTPGFNHDTTAYELTGRHDEVKCDKCHLDARLSPGIDGKGHWCRCTSPSPSRVAPTATPTRTRARSGPGAPTATAPPG
jgi:hypothetical protein